MVPEFENFSLKKNWLNWCSKNKLWIPCHQVLGRKIGTQKKIAIVDESIMASSSTQDFSMIP